MTRKAWLVSSRPQATPKDVMRCEATVYIVCDGVKESGRCRRRWTLEYGDARYCCQHHRIARRSLNGRDCSGS